MKAIVVKLSNGLFAYSDEDAEKLKRIPNGKAVEISFSSARNPLHHRKYFKLISVAWDYQPESVKEFYKDKEIFRKTIELACGHCEVVYDLKNERFVEIPKSISFDSMSQEEFSELYDKVMLLITTKFLVHLDEKDKAIFFDILDGN